MNRTLAGLVGGVPELFAGALTAVCILVPYYTLHERTPTTMTEHIPDPAAWFADAEALEIRQHEDGQPYVVTSPLPEYILVDAGLWAQAEVYAPDTERDTPVGWLWVEEVPNADVGATDAEGNLAVPDARHDIMLHIEASNVSASYLLLAEQPDGNRLLQLRAWGER